jgi:hypothetical protein
MYAMETFDTKLFIHEIEAHPAIWDMPSELYSNRTGKTKSWEELCQVFVANFKEKSIKEKNNAGELIFVDFCILIHIFIINTLYTFIYTIYIYTCIPTSRPRHCPGGFAS